MTAAQPELLVLRALGLGDLLTGVPALRALARALPEHRLVLALPAALEPLARLTGVVDEVLDARGLDEPLPPRRPDVAVNLHGRGPRSHELLLACRPRRLVAFAGPGAPDGPRWRPDEHETRRWTRLVREATGAAADPEDLRLAAPAIAPPVPDGAPGPYAVLHPGAAAPARRWPVERWAQVARAVHDRGLTVLLTGSAEERPAGLRVAALAGLPPAWVLAGDTGPLELAALVARAQLVLSADTGVAHLASAYARPSVTLFGPVPPSEWGPPASGPHRALWAGRRGDPHGRVTDPGLLELEAPAVLAVALALLGRPAARAA